MSNMESILMSGVIFFLFQGQVCAILTRMPPMVTSTFQSVYWVTAQDSLQIELQCNATGIPKPNITWYKDGTTVSNTINTQVTEGRVLRTGVEGRYYCSAENEFGTSVSKTVLVKETKFPPFQMFEGRHIFGKENEAVSIPCFGRPLCIPESECLVEWKKGSATGESINPDQRTAVDSKGTLYFLHAKLSDRTFTDNNGYLKTYGCGVFNQLMLLFRKSSKIQLSIEQGDPTSGKIIIPPKTLFNDDVTGEVGGPATLQCIFGGLPVPTVQWIFKNKLINVLESDDFFHLETFPNGENNTRKLMIRELRPDHEGEYECRAVQALTGSSHSNTETARLVLNVTGPPQFPEPMKPQITPLHSDAYFMCEANSLPKETPPEEPIWYKNGRTIDFGNEASYSTSMEGKRLRVSEVDFSLTSTITCTVNNSVGETSSEAYLLVIDDIEILEQPPSHVKMSIGQILNLHVLAETDPELSLSYQWSFKQITGSHLSQTEFPSFIQVYENGKRLLVDSSTMTIENIYRVIGEYTVEMFHMYDSKNISVAVTVTNFSLDDVIMINRPPKSITFSVGDTTSIYVSALNNPVSNTRYRWMFREMDGTTFYEKNLPKYFRISNKGKNLTITGRNMTKTSVYDVVGTLTVDVFNDFSNKTFTVNIMADIGSNEGIWTDWTDWSSCSRTCGEGSASRTRSCQQIIHRNKLTVNNSSDLDCDGSETVVMTCAENVRCEDAFTVWSQWSACEGEGRNGQQTRTRKCTQQAPASDTDCTEPLQETRPCPLGACQVVNEQDSTPVILFSLAVVIAVAGIVMMSIGILLIRKSKKTATTNINHDFVPLEHKDP